MSIVYPTVGCYSRKDVYYNIYIHNTSDKSR